MTKTLFSDKELNDRLKKYFSPKAKPEPCTWVFYAKSYLESLNLVNLPVEFDSKFNNDLKESLMKEIEENSLKQSEYNNFINSILIKKKRRKKNSTSSLRFF